jgi:hypothetical protein
MASIATVLFGTAATSIPIATVEGVSLGAATVPATAGILTASNIAAGAMIGGLGLTAAGLAQSAQAQSQAALQAGAAQASELQGQQAVAAYNAQVQEQEARAIERQTQIRLRRHAEEASRLGSSLLASTGAAGVVTTSGAPLALMAKQAAESELDAMMIDYEGSVAAARARNQGNLDTLQGSIYGQRAGTTLRSSRKTASAYRTGGAYSVGSTLLTGFGSMASQRY